MGGGRDFRGGRRGGGRDGGRSGGRGRGRPNVDTSMDLPGVLYSQYPFRGGVDQRYDMMQFVRAAAACDATLLNEFLLRLGHNDVSMDKLRAVAAARFSVADRTFQDVTLPLLTLLGSRAFLDSVHTTDVKRVLRVVLLGEPLFLRRVRNCLEHDTDVLHAHGLLATSADTVARVLHALVRKLPDSAQDDDVYDLICAVCEWVHTCEYAQLLTSAAATLDDALEMCMELVPARRVHHADQSPATVDYLIRGLRTGLSLADADAGADAFSRGPRHDNDAADFRSVRVIPTDLEMRCLEPPNLPTRTRLAAGVDADADVAMEQHLDLHFRLLREDVLAQIRRGVQWALRPATLAACLHAQQWTPPPREANVPLLNVALDARLEQLHGSIYRGVMFQISAKQPLIGRKKPSTAQLKEFWEREQRYKQGSLVCIAVGVGHDHGEELHEDDEDEEQFPRYAQLGARELIFATVAENNPADLFSNVERFSVRLALLEGNRTAELVTKLTDPRQTSLLMEVRGLFFTAYEPILRSLQWLDARTLSPSLQQCLYGDRQAAWQQKPAYARPLTTYNLQFLVKSNPTVRVDLQRVPGDDYATLVRHLHAYEQRGLLTLDRSQCEAMAAAMTQQVCLIQGPPGTGKSYVGTRIVRAILNQRVQTGPILCVCYTNHALDQFLEGLVENGLPLDAIVRVGGRSKSELLETRSLNVLKRASLQSRQEQQRFGKLFSECRTIEETYFDGFVAASTSSSSFQKWMEENQWDEYAEIVGLEDEDGFQAQGHRNKDKKQRWHAWEQGEKRGADGMWALPLATRQALVDLWETEWRDSARASIDAYLDKYRENVQEAEQVNNANLLRILRANKVVGVTTTGCAIHQALIRALAPKIVVCEEAGEVLEAHLLACLSEATEQLIQIGDHMQLRPILNEHELSRERQSPGPRYDLDVSMFERLVDERGSGPTRVPGALVTLHVQRRMRPEICDLVRRTLYPQLEDGPQVLNYAPTRGFTHNLWFLDHDEREDTGELSHANAFEAELIVELVAYAIKQGYGLNEITILTPYLGQLVQIRRRLQAKNFRFALDDKDVEKLHAAGVDDVEKEEEKEEDEAESKTEIHGRRDSVVVKTLRDCVRLSTVDNFQGNESLLVFISTVRSNARGTTGFLKTFNRVNVMLSRAQGAMYLLGSASTVRRSPKAEMFNGVLNILEDTGAIGRTIGLQCQRHGTITQVATAQEIRELSPDGGCRVPCDQRLRCGHSCPRLCHADDERHVAAICLEPCVKRVAACGHLCQARCHEVCRCRETVDKVELPCGHSLYKVKCADVHSKVSTLKCRTKVQVRLPFCGHVRDVPCPQAQALDRAVRRNDWAAVWTLNVQCDAVCGGPQDCGHACQHDCGRCLASNLVGIADMAVRTDMEEAAARTRRGDHHAAACRHACERPLLCGHACASFCHAAGECPPCEAPCRNECVHSKCPRKCHEACASCADACAWSCPHEGACDLPCGSPCTRVPCDLRCTKRLAQCGHQCPGLCGEPCLSSAYCRECPAEISTHHDDVVDHVMFSTLVAHDPSESPLVRLRCGHCFTVETLDGWLGIDGFYEREDDEWVAVRPLRAPQTGDAQVKGCPTCRAPVAGVFRYGRLINFYHLHQSELKYLQEAMAAVAASSVTRNGPSPLSSSSRNRQIMTFRSLWTKPTPTQEVSTKESSRLARIGRTGESLNLASFRSIMQRQAVLVLGLELLALLVEKVQTLKVSPSSEVVLRHTYTEGREVEASLRAMARESNAQRSAHEVTLRGMELCVAWLHHGRDTETARQGVLQELRDAKRVLMVTGASEEMRTRATRLEEMAKRLGHLTPQEKDEIFQVFAKGNDAFAQGFGGRWYQCPSGHPYVITECGGAMERANCPECGAAIGGENHRLDASNASAEAYFST